MRTDDHSRQLNEPRESPSDDALERYLAGRSPATERSAVEEWLEADSNRQSTMQSIVHELSVSLPGFDAEAMLERTRQRIDHAVRTRTSPWRRASSVIRRPVVALPTAALILLALGLTMRDRSTLGGGASVGASAWAREVVAQPGKQAVVDLADGSRVVLAAGSTLRIPADFARGRGGTRRELELVGKAHFRVEHDEARPFIVRTATAVVEDLGTEFVVRAYPESPSTQVVVASGAVAVHRAPIAGAAPRPGAFDRPLLVLAPGDIAELDSVGTVTLARNVDVAAHLSWTTGVLVLDGALLATALSELGRWYDVEFTRDAAALDSLRVSGEFRNESVDVAMQRLGLMLGVRVTRNGRTITISAPPAHR